MSLLSYRVAKVGANAQLHLGEKCGVICDSCGSCCLHWRVDVQGRGVAFGGYFVTRAEGCRVRGSNRLATSVAEPPWFLTESVHFPQNGWISVQIVIGKDGLYRHPPHGSYLHWPQLCGPNTAAQPMISEKILLLLDSLFSAKIASHFRLGESVPIYIFFSFICYFPLNPAQTW